RAEGDAAHRPPHATAQPLRAVHVERRARAGVLRAARAHRVVRWPVGQRAAVPAAARLWQLSGNRPATERLTQRNRPVARERGSWPVIPANATTSRRPLVAMLLLAP